MNKSTRLFIATALLLSAFVLTLGIQLRSERALRRVTESQLAEADAEIRRLEAAISDARRQARTSAAASSPSVAVEAPAPEVAVVPEEAATITTVAVSRATGPRPLSDAAMAAIGRFDVAMDREFDRLDRREGETDDIEEVATIQKIKNELTALDDLYRQADMTTDPEEQMIIRRDMQKTMGSIIGLSHIDRNERLGKLATDIGYDNPQDVEAFVREIDQIYRETHMDWTKLFNRAPPPGGAPPAGIPGNPNAITVSPGPQ